MSNIYEIIGQVGGIGYRNLHVFIVDLNSPCARRRENGFGSFSCLPSAHYTRHTQDDTFDIKIFEKITKRQNKKSQKLNHDLLFIERATNHTIVLSPLLSHVWVLFRPTCCNSFIPWKKKKKLLHVPREYLLAKISKEIVRFE